MSVSVTVAVTMTMAVTVAMTIPVHEPGSMQNKHHSAYEKKQKYF